MIRVIEGGNIFSLEADALVNPVNCRGVMGAGLAKEFKTRYPECVPPYLAACKSRSMQPGDVLYVHLDVRKNAEPHLVRPAVLLFATKDHWRVPSRREWIDRGLRTIAECYTEWGISTLALPAVGCGLGGLEWSVVHALIETNLAGCELRVLAVPPKQTGEPDRGRIPQQGPAGA
jgi:O-acetyl-ADP-ribose deacetylase (regulator of RNase III)